jgi:hypothetical protein
MFHKREKRRMNRKKEEVEKFVQRYFDLELLINPQASDIRMSGGNNIADCLQRAIIQYMNTNPSMDSEKLSKEGSDVFAYMTKIISYGMVTAGSELLGKLEAERKKNAKLLKDLSICLTNYAVLERKYNQMTGNIPKLPSKSNQSTTETDENDSQP